MGSGRAAAPSFRKINSETNLAVELLLAVSDGRATEEPKTATRRARASRSTTSIDVRTDTSEYSDSTESAAPSVSSPSLTQTALTQIASSPRTAASALGRSDGPLFKYTREERAEALERFREKKRRRQFHKRVRYMVRKRLAETRPRYKGRFSKPPPGENYDDGTPGPPAEESVKKMEGVKTAEVAVEH